MSIEFVRELDRPSYHNRSNQAVRCLVRNTVTRQHYSIETQQMTRGPHSWVLAADSNGTTTSINYLYTRALPRCKMIELLRSA